ncbi:hypothetical protein BJN34_22675 [Cupriavidus necator]|uniref:Uncharacterized protein n=1 Tax=Cupriavidus necator TaxID=106590 RepID=A0A1U9UVH4_CUPNE|nr:hypothetical protein [Cupriavidus necator]AQV96672.1 hypothetical protein BJN34_22675 [Cupriavidus necator]
MTKNLPLSVETVRPRLPADAFLKRHPLLNGAKSVERALRLTYGDAQPYMDQLKHDEVDAVRVLIALIFEPTAPELEFIEDGIQATSDLLRARAVEGNVFRDLDSQARALAGRTFKPTPRPLHVEPYSRVAIFSTEMDENRFARLLQSQAGIAVEIEELGGLPVRMAQIVALVVCWPNCGTLRGLVERVLVALDEALRDVDARLYSVWIFARGLPKSSPGTFVEVMLQLFNVGLIYVYGVNSGNVATPRSNDTFVFLADVSRATGIRVLLSGTCALLNHLSRQSAAADELLHKASLEISGYLPETARSVASAYRDALPRLVRERLSLGTVTGLLERAGFQRRIYVQALTAVVEEILATGCADAKEQYLVADRVLGRRKGLLEAIGSASRGVTLSSNYRARYQEALPSSTKYLEEPKRIRRSKT